MGARGRHLGRNGQLILLDQKGGDRGKGIVHPDLHKVYASGGSSRIPH